MKKCPVMIDKKLYFIVASYSNSGSVMVHLLQFLTSGIEMDMELKHVLHTHLPNILGLGN